MGYKKYKDILLHLNNLRKFIGYEIFREAIGSEIKFQTMETPDNGKVLVLSPHPDDDVIGCGGVLKLHTDQGDNVRTLFLTDGSGGVPKNKITTLKERKNLGTQRESEAKTAALILGVTETVFWRYKDGQLNTNSTSLKLLKTLIDDYKPDIIYSPSFLDPHPDHFETAKLLASYLEHNDYQGKIYTYEVWSPIYANRIINLGNACGYKKQAILAHKSQLISRDYESAVMGLAKYRAGMNNAGEYAEAFFCFNRKLYTQLFRLMNLKK